MRCSSLKHYEFAHFCVVDMLSLFPCFMFTLLSVECNYERMWYRYPVPFLWPHLRWGSEEKKLFGLRLVRLLLCPQVQRQHEHTLTPSHTSICNLRCKTADDSRGWHLWVCCCVRLCFRGNWCDVEGVRDSAVGGKTRNSTQTRRKENSPGF